MAASSPLRTLAQSSDEKRGRRHLLTVAVEDYFQASALNSLIPEQQWKRFESRIASNTMRTLDLLDAYDVRATFFVLGWIGDELPEVVRAIAARGHEIASRGYYHHAIEQFSRMSFREDLLRAREALEKASAQRILGYRIARGSLGLHDTWALDVLADEGFAYDSSFYPRFRSIVTEPWRRFPHRHHHRGRDLFEFPLSTWGTDTFLFPAAGGNYFRQLPTTIMRQAVADWTNFYCSPFNAYFHIWELDPDPPKISAASWLSRIRQYRNLHRMPVLIRYLLENYTFTSIADYLGVELARDAEAGVVASHCAPCSAHTSTPQRNAARELARTSRPTQTPVTLVIPCFNEALVLPYLANTLDELEHGFESDYTFQFLFVDDASTDDTWRSLQRLFGNRDDCTLIHHAQNRGVAGATKTGLRYATTEIVAVIDCDCTYDPKQLQRMIPLLDADTALVTASPYHALGTVRNVPAWRLFLSRNVSRLYRLLLHHQFATYTSCFRVFRRSLVQNLETQHDDFLGIVEMLAVLDWQGAKIVECPAVLETRLLGASKMKTLVSIAGHLKLLARLAWRRIFSHRAAVGR